MKLKQALMSLCAILMLTTQVKTLNAQVTIGSAHKPNPGALLDLKQENKLDGSANSTKGLLLPRLDLINLEILNPIKIGVGESKQDYVGLVVYNVGYENCNIKPGVYIWDGETWICLGEGEESLIDQSKFIDNGDNTGTLTDYEGNNYPVNFYDESGWWMTKDLRSLISKDGLYIDCHTGVFQNLAYTTIDTNENHYLNIIRRQPLNQMVTYDLDGQPISESVDVFSNKYGFNYTAKQAERACPEGWEIPSQADWIDLLFSINESPVASITNNTVGEKVKKTGLYISQDGVTSSWEGTNLSKFNALPSGYITAAKEAGGFGNAVSFWSSTKAGDGQSYNAWRLAASETGFVSTYQENDTHLSIRCKRIQPTCDGISAGTIVDHTDYDDENGILTDHEGNTYYTREFGEAGVWMTQNLRTRSYLNQFTCKDTAIPFRPNRNASIADIEEKWIAYPSPIAGEKDGSIVPGIWNSHPEMGLLYSYAAVVKDFGKTTQFGTGDGGNNPQDIQVRGICPIGWHVPSDYEWSVLEKELATNPEKYSTQSTPTYWDDIYFQYPAAGGGAEYRPKANIPSSIPSDFLGHQIVMVAPNNKQPDGFKLTTDYIEGKSFPFDAPKPEDRGFSALNLGYSTNSGMTSIARYALFFTSSNNPGLGVTEDASWHRRTSNFPTDQGGVVRGLGRYYHLFNVRCVKNNR